jgi:hypothetical protein
MYPFYLGIDLHLKRTYVVLMNCEGEMCRCKVVPLFGGGVGNN